MALVLSPTEFRLLDGLRLAPRRTFHGRIRGERLTRRKGVSIEFADYRDYTEGDDLRHLDWNVLARLQTPVMKTYQDEEDLAVYLVVDATESMGFGEPSKLDLAKRLAAAFAYVALCGQDAVIPIAIPQRGVRPTRRGRSAFPQVSGWLDGIQSSGSPRSLAESLRELAAAGLRPGMVVLLTDALDPNAPACLRVLGGVGHEACLVQVLAPEELDPDLEGDLRLLDAESDSVVELTANRDALKLYRENLAAHNASLAEACRRHGGRFLQVSSADSVEQVVRDRLRKEGWFAA